MEKLNLDKKSLRKFGFVMGIALLLVTVILFIKHKTIVSSVAAVAVMFFIAAIFWPSILKLIYILWMRLALVLSWINTRLILCVLYYLVFTPIGLIMRVFGADPLGRKIDRKKASYWKKKEGPVFSPQNYEKQF